MGRVIAVDTSVAIPLLIASHEAHAGVLRWATGRTLALSGHALIETYSVLTRLPGDARVSGRDAAHVMDDNFPEQIALSVAQAADAHREFARLGIEGAAAYDALVAFAAREAGAPLATRDARARTTYEAVGVEVELL